MRVAVLISELVREGGAERQALCLSRELQRMGHEVVVYTLAHNPSSCYRDLASELEIVSVGRHSLRGRTVRIPNRILLYVEMRRLAEAVGVRFDVLNAHAWPAHWAALRAEELTPPPRPPVVWMCNDYIWGTRRTQLGSGRLWVRWIRRAVRRVLHELDARWVAGVARTAVLDSEVQREVQDGYKIKAEIVRSGLDPARLQRAVKDPAAIRKRFKIAADSFLLLFLGILMPHRRLEDAIEAVGRVRAAGAEVDLLIAGSLSYDVCYAAALQNHVRMLGLDNHVTFTDCVSEVELSSLYHVCDAFVFPNEEQTWGLAVTEAMACAKPVIVSTGAGVHEVLTDGQTALFVPPRRPDLLATQVLRLIGDRTFAATLAERGCELVTRTLTWRRYAESMEELFRAAIHERQLSGEGNRPITQTASLTE